MRYLSTLVLGIGICGIALGQNSVSTPAGQSLKTGTDTVVVNGILRIGNTLSLSNIRFMSLHKTSAGELNTFVGPNSGNPLMTARWNSFLGENSGAGNTTGANNTFLGAYSGASNTSAINNIFLGYKSGFAASSGKYNVVVGSSAGLSITTAESSTMFGADAGKSTSTGFFNTFLGSQAGFSNVAGASNTAVGYGAGLNNNGTGNVFLGSFAGSNETGSNKLYIGNSATAAPLVYGEFPPSATAGGKFVVNGKVGIGSGTFPASVIDTSNVSVPTTDFVLFVNGSMLSKSLTVSTSWADYVFDTRYRLLPLPDVEHFIQLNHHLPGIRSGKRLEEEGVDLGEISRIQQEKIEELTLYLIEQKKHIIAQQQVLLEQKAQRERDLSTLEKLR